MTVSYVHMPVTDRRQWRGVLVLLLLGAFVLQGLVVRLHAHAYAFAVPAPEHAVANVPVPGKVPGGHLPPADRDSSKCQVCLAAAFAGSFVAASPPQLVVDPDAADPTARFAQTHDGRRVQRAWSSRAPPQA